MKTSMAAFLIICVLIAFINSKKVKESNCSLCEKTISSIILNQPEICTKYNENRPVFTTCEKIKSTFQDKYQIDYNFGGQPGKTTPHSMVLHNICTKMGYCEKTKRLDTTKENEVAIAKEMLKETQKTIKKITKKIKKISEMYENLNNLTTRNKRYVTPSLVNELPIENEINSFCDNYDRIVRNKIIDLNWIKNKLTQTTTEPKIRNEKKIECNTLIKEIDTAISSLNSIRFQISELMRKSN